MTDLRAKPEIARGRFNVERPAISSRPAGIDFDAYGLAGGCCRSSDVVRRDFLRMRDEITELLAAFCIAGLRGAAASSVDITIVPLGHRRDARAPAGERPSDDLRA